MNASDTFGKALHPYYPLGVEIAGYIKNVNSVPYLLGVFAVGCAVIFTLTGFIAKRQNPAIRSAEMLTIMWFVLSGSIHLFFEGYYAYNFRSMGPLQSMFGQMWKEYALSDSRYLTKDSFVLCMESLTAIFWGPLSFFVAYLITNDRPLRHPFQIIVSLGQIYGDVLYFSTCFFDHMIYGKQYSRPEAYYFWGYYVFLNAIWIVIPGLLIWSSSTEISRTILAFNKLESTLNKARVTRSNGQIAIANGDRDVKKTR